MKMSEAKKIIGKKEKKKPEPKISGFMVSFEKREGGILSSIHFPDKHGGEKLIKTEVKAWEWAKKFANATGDDHVNIYVIDSNFRPVSGYRLKIIRPYPCY